MQATNAPRIRGRLRRLWRENPYFSTGMALALLLIVMTGVLVWKNDFDSFAAFGRSWVSNCVNICRNNAVVGIIALGMTLVILTVGIDLAVGSTMVCMGTILLVLMDTGAGGVLGALDIAGIPAILIACAACMACGAGAGALIGVGVTKGRIPPFIVTLGAMNIIRSLAQHFMQGRAAPAVPDAFKLLSNQVVLGQRILPVVYWLVLALLLHWVSRNTAFGRHVYAVGSNARTTRLSGISVDRVLVKVYALEGLLIGIAAIVESARMGSMNTANAGQGYELDAIAAVVVGGTRMSGGRGSILSTVIGMLIIGVMNTLLNLLGVPPFLRAAFKGAIIILAVLLQRKDAE